jgi:hypothetical protein
VSWTAIAVLAAGAYGFKALGLVVLGPLAARSAGRYDTNGDDTTDNDTGDDDTTGGDTTDYEASADAAGRSLLLRATQLLPPALLAALVVTQTVADGTELTVDARLAGVVAGAIATWRKAPFWLVLLVAAAVAAAIRQI